MVQSTKLPKSLFITSFMLLGLAQLVSLDLIEEILPSNYNPEIRPQFGGNADQIAAAVYINSFGPVSEKDMSISVDMYLSLAWTDPGLAEMYQKMMERNPREHRNKDQKTRKNRNVSTDFKNTSNESASKNGSNPVLDAHGLPSGGGQVKTRKKASSDSKHFLYLGADHFNHIWKPDFFFPDAIELKRPILNGEESLQVRLDEGGTVAMSMRLMTTFRCMMPLHFFPMDSQSCDLCLSQYKYPDSEQNIVWKNETGFKKQQLASPKFTVDGCLRQKYKKLANFEDYPNICLELRFYRKISQFVVIMFLPSVLLTVLSFLNFWIDKSAIPARASLSITTILAQITLIVGLAERFHSGSDIRLADIYLIINFCFTFSTLIEFAIVSYPATCQKRKLQLAAQTGLSGGTKDGLTETKEDSGRDVVSKGQQTYLGRKLTKWYKQSNADYISRWMFPALFFLWHVTYFSLSFALTKRYQYSDDECV